MRVHRRRGQAIVASFLLVGWVAGVAAGCGGKATSSSEAIQHASTMRTPEEQATYLIRETREFLSAKDYQEAITTAQYVLSRVDANSQAAKDLLEQAKTKLAMEAQAVVGEAKQGLGL